MDIEQIKLAMNDRRNVFYGVCDKVVTIAASLLAVTVTFRTSLLSANGGTIRCGWLIIVVWAALALTVMFGLLTTLGHASAVTRVIAEMVAGRPGVGIPNRFYHACPWIMVIAFVTALAAFIVFAALNTPI